MKLKRYEQEQLLKSFPKLELSYEKKIHKKVQSDIYLTIPKGKKYFAWFRSFKKQNVCFLMNIDRRYNSIETIFINVCSFDKILCSGKGTILYGTIFTVNKMKCFNIENIFYSKGSNMCHFNQYDKLREVSSILKHYLRQTIFFKSSVVFGSPIISDNYYDLESKIKNLSYDLYSIQSRLLYRDKPFLNLFIKIEREIYKYFEVRATIIDDIYELYYINGLKLEKYKVACIPDYKTSVKMNSIFRNIKENRNLDLLEESDDEEEFENIDLDKFVDLDKRIVMKCLFINKFDSWKPINIANHEISPRREIICFKKK